MKQNNRQKQQYSSESNYSKKSIFVNFLWVVGLIGLAVYMIYFK